MKLDPTPIFVSRVARIGIDGLKTFRELMSCLASPTSDISEGNTKRVIDFYEGNEIDALR
jgi:hypothetical protein